jgi:hypothetical protein
MFFEQHSLEPNLGAAYFWLTLVKGGRELQRHALEDWMEEGNRALGVMEKHLAAHDYFVAEGYSIADIALYAYTHVAQECDYDLAPFPAIRAWLDRVAHEPGHVKQEIVFDRRNVVVGRDRRLDRGKAAKPERLALTFRRSSGRQKIGPNSETAGASFRLDAARTKDAWGPPATRRRHSRYRRQHFDSPAVVFGTL